MIDIFPSGDPKSWPLRIIFTYIYLYTNKSLNNSEQINANEQNYPE